MAKEKWEICGSDALVGATITYVEYDGSVLATKDGEKYRTEITRDWATVIAKMVALVIQRW